MKNYTTFISSNQQQARPGIAEPFKPTFTMQVLATFNAEKFSRIFLYLILAGLCSFWLPSCKQPDKWVDVDPAFSRYVDA